MVILFSVIALLFLLWELNCVAHEYSRANAEAVQKYPTQSGWTKIGFNVKQNALRKAYVLKAVYTPLAQLGKDVLLMLIVGVFVGIMGFIPTIQGPVSAIATVIVSTRLLFYNSRTGRLSWKYAVYRLRNHGKLPPPTDEE